MKKLNMIVVGKRIRQARVLAGLTQEQLAEKIGVSRTAIVRWESAETEPTLEHLLALTTSLHVSADYLLDIDDDGKTMDILMDVAAKFNQILMMLQEKEDRNED